MQKPVGKWLRAYAFVGLVQTKYAGVTAMLGRFRSCPVS
jgi:hypothetical protein